MLVYQHLPMTPNIVIHEKEESSLSSNLALRRRNNNNNTVLLINGKFVKTGKKAKSRIADRRETGLFKKILIINKAVNTCSAVTAYNALHGFTYAI